MYHGLFRTLEEGAGRAERGASAVVQRRRPALAARSRERQWRRLNGIVEKRGNGPTSSATKVGSKSNRRQKYFAFPTREVVALLADGS
jgi:hypothetical protein